MTDLTHRAAPWHSPRVFPLAFYLSSLSIPDRFPAFINEAMLLTTELTRDSTYGSQVS